MREGYVMRSDTSALVLSKKNLFKEIGHMQCVNRFNTMYNSVVLMENAQTKGLLMTSMKQRETSKHGIAKFARPDQVLYQQASAIITSYLTEKDANGNEIGIAHETIISDAGYLDAVNYPIANLFLQAISTVSFQKSLSQKHIYLNVNERVSEKLMLTNLRRSKMDRMAVIAWYQQYAYCVHIEDEGEQQIKFAMMLTHLNKYFREIYGINAWIDIRNCKCLALIRTSKNGNQISGEIKEQEEKECFSVSGKISDLIQSLNNHKNNFLDFPIVDETDFSGNIAIKITSDLSTIEVINRELERYNLKLTEAERRIRIVAIESTA